MPVLKYLIVILSDASVSFCHYESGRKDAGVITYDRLKKAVVYALKNNLRVNFLYPGFRLPKEHDRLIEDVEHVKIVPYKLRNTYKDSVAVVEAADIKMGKDISEENIILRLSPKELRSLGSYTKLLIKKCRRINLVIKDPGEFTKTDADEYGNILKGIIPSIARKPVPGNLPEINFLTDRIILDGMNNCDAGLSHLTFAPDGRLYLCPAFYFEGVRNSIGEISNDITIPNRRLLEIKYSPICRICDAYQCKRCVYLSKKLTGEVNTPSWQQCRISHAEREASRILLNELKKMKFPGAHTREIPELNYDDPFEAAVKNKISIKEFKKLQ